MTIWNLGSGGYHDTASLALMYHRIIISLALTGKEYKKILGFKFGFHSDAVVTVVILNPHSLLIMLYRLYWSGKPFFRLSYFVSGYSKQFSSHLSAF